MISKHPLRVAFIVTGDGESGTYFRYHNLAKGLVRLGHEVVVYGQCGSGRWATRHEARDGVKYVLAPSAPGNRWIDYSINPGNLFWRMIQRIAQADVYHLFQPHGNSAFPWLALQKFRSREGALFVWDWDDLWCGGLIPTEPRRVTARWHYRLLNRLEHSLPRRAALVTTCSAYLARIAESRGASHTALVHNGYWPGDAPGDRTTLRKEFGLREDAFYLGFIGWTPTEISWCLEALLRLGANVRLASCGYDIRRDLEAYPGLADRIDYLGKVTSEQARRLMHAIDVGLLPLARTPFNESRLPIKFADYLAAGVPAICGDVGEVGVLGRRIRGAILCPPEKEKWVAACVAAVREMQRDPAAHLPDRIELARHLSWAHLAHQLEAAYFAGMERLSQNSPGPSPACSDAPAHVPEAPR